MSVNYYNLLLLVLDSYQANNKNGHCPHRGIDESVVNVRMLNAPAPGHYGSERGCRPGDGQHV